MGLILVSLIVQCSCISFAIIFIYFKFSDGGFLIRLRYFEVCHLTVLCWLRTSLFWILSDVAVPDSTSVLCVC